MENTIQPTPEQLAQMRDFTGENTMAQESLKLPFIKFDGKPDRATSGHFLLAKGKNQQGKQEYSDLGDTLEGVIIRVRKAVQTGLDSKRNLYTREFDSYNEMLDLIDRDTREVIASATYSDLKNQYADLRLSNILYVYSQKQQQVYRLSVGGGSLSNLWAYLEQFNQGNKTVMMVITKFGNQEAKSDKGIFYMQMTFELVSEAENWQMIWGELQKINNALGTPNSKKAKLLEAKAQETPPPTEEELPVIQADENIVDEENKEDEISVEDIPF
jgi:hypothetical protein